MCVSLLTAEFLFLGILADLLKMHYRRWRGFQLLRCNFKSQSCRNRSRMKFLLMSLLVGVGCACNHKLVIDDDIKRPHSEEDRAAIRHAPIVVVGLMKKDEPLGPIVFGKAWNAHLQLHRVDLNVEQYLEGARPAKILQVFYYDIADAYDGNRLIASWYGSLSKRQYRRIYFIRNDFGKLRLACDVVDNCTIPVFSGLSEPVNPGDSIDEKIADVLLTPGQGVDVGPFTDELGRNLHRVDKRFWRAKLLQLTENPDTRIRDRGCEEADENLGRTFVKQQPRCRSYLKVAEARGRLHAKL